MNRSIVLIALVLGPLALGATGPAPVAWTADLAHCRAEFTVSHMVLSRVWGHIPIRALAIEAPAGSVIPDKLDAQLDVAHEDTDNHTRDADLRSATYFDVAHYPTVVFHSTKIAQTGAEDFTVYGNLTIKDVTKPVSFPVHVEGTIPDGGGATRVGYHGALHVDRRDFDLVDKTLTPAGVLLVGYVVAIELTVEAVH
jgi:polyisoprenoid-binding protein YceI